MDNSKFNKVLENTLNKCVNTLGKKADEYATEDRLHNFKVAAEIQNCTPITALGGMMAKHTVSTVHFRKINIAIKLERQPIIFLAMA